MGGEIIDKDAAWAAIDSQRLRTADLLEGLSEEQWRHPSLCDGWTVRDVAAHLTLQQVRLGQAVLTAVKHPGSLNRLIRDSARSRANLPVDQLVAGIRAMVGSRRHNIGVSYLETLIDILVHGQDIAIPLQLNLEMLPTATAVAATRVWSYGGKGKARVFHKIPFQGFRLTATDISWSAGEGTEILGPISAILLLLTGRLAALRQMTGPASRCYIRNSFATEATCPWAKAVCTSIEHDIRRSSRTNQNQPLSGEARSRKPG